MKKPLAAGSPRHGRCLVVSAWPPELSALRARLSKLPPRARRRVVIGSVGVGLVEAALGAARLLAQHRPRAMLLVGTAGVYPGKRPDLPLGSAVVANAFVLLPEILSDKRTLVPKSMPRRERSTPALATLLCGLARLPLANVACPLAITTSDKAAIAARKLSGSVLENLEAFAVARAAATARVPFAAILGVANHVGPRGHGEWKQHGPRAAAAACQAVLAFFASLDGDGKPQRTQRTQRRK